MQGMGRVSTGVVATMVGLSSLLAGGTETSTAQTTRSSIVLILADDQRWDTLWAMPQVQSSLVDRGVSFSEAVVNNPWCCPSRASILTGQYSHSTKVWRNTPPNGGYDSFNASSTIATWLRTAGYRTAHIGKYLNGYGSLTIPPGWDRWVAFKGKPAYYDYTLNVDGASKSYGSETADYSTDVLTKSAVRFIRSTASDKPLFLYFTPFAVHDPYVPALRHSNAFSDLPPWSPPSYNEADISDKPAYIRSLPATNAQTLVLKQLRTLLAVDDAVGRIMTALADTGRLANTAVVFASDHGFLWGEHRVKAKVVPYEESIRFPLVMRYDPATSAPRTDSNLVANIDLAPTFADLANIGAPGAEGVSLVPLLEESNWQGRSDLLIEHLQGNGGPSPFEESVPTYCAVRNSNSIYVYYKTGEREFYDLATDPYQLQNRVRDPLYAEEVNAMHVRLRTLCNPPPPGLSIP